jgi:hypothetical protein
MSLRVFFTKQSPRLPIEWSFCTVQTSRRFIRSIFMRESNLRDVERCILKRVH